MAGQGLTLIMKGGKRIPVSLFNIVKWRMKNWAIHNVCKHVALFADANLIHLYSNFRKNTKHNSL